MPLRNFKSFALCWLLAFPTCALAADQPGHALRMMKTPGFWISRRASPDAVIMSPQAIDEFNAGLRNDKKLTKDIFNLEEDLKTESLAEDLQKSFSGIAAKGYYTAEGAQNDQAFMDDVKRNMNLSGVVAGQAPRYGLVVHFADQRFLPTNKGLYEDKGSLDFDQLQNSALDVGTPVAIVHTSADGLWYYTMSGISDGWIMAKNIAVGDMAQVRQFAQNNDFAVVIRPKADIFLNEAMTGYDDYVRMGARLPLAGVDAGRVTVDVPVMESDGSLTVKEAYMNAEDVNTGFLPFTARNIYKEALMMLNQPYGWGDSHGEQDCSRFVQMVFATVGINLPRDSKDQAQVSTNPVNFNGDSDDEAKLAAITKVSAANTLLAMRGHIMLYLGLFDGRPYVIHDTTADGLDRVVISDLSLGQGSEKGSLLQRLTRAVTIE